MKVSSLDRDKSYVFLNGKQVQFTQADTSEGWVRCTMETITNSRGANVTRNGKVYGMVKAVKFKGNVAHITEGPKMAQMECKVAPSMPSAYRRLADACDVVANLVETYPELITYDITPASLLRKLEKVKMALANNISSCNMSQLSKLEPLVNKLEGIRPVTFI